MNREDCDFTAERVNNIAFIRHHGAFNPGSSLFTLLLSVRWGSASPSSPLCPLDAASA
jgi:hypothetical protein